MPHLVTVPQMCVEPGKPIPAELNSKLNPSKHTIVLSFGSSVDDLPPVYIEHIIGALKKLEQYNIIWKTTSNIAVPGHVLKMKWLPQNDLLAHPRTKLFISHCGAGGVYEALYHGVPILCIPLFGEQPHNAFMVQSKGYGKIIELKTTSKAEILKNIEVVLTDKQIQAAVLKTSQLLKDRPLAPREEAAYWVEHIMKFGGQHLRPATMDMPLYEMLCLDILAVLAAITVTVLTLTCCGIRLMLRCVCRPQFKDKRE